MTYQEKLRSPKWQRRRLEIMQRDKFMCQFCFDTETTLNVHHLTYSSKNPWDASDNELITLCEECHNAEHEIEPIAKDAIFNALHARGFSTYHIIQLSSAFHNMPKFHSQQDLMIGVLVFALQNEDELLRLKELFFERVKEANSLFE